MESNYFKNRKEVEQFFKGEYFEFSFYSDGTIFFNTLRPIFLGDELFSFQISFYCPYVGGGDFFRFSSFTDWLDRYQLSSIIKIDESNNFNESLFFQTFDENFKP